MLTTNFRNSIFSLQREKRAKEALLHLLFYYPAFFSLLFYFFSTGHVNSKEFFETFIYISILLLISHFLPFYRLRFVYLLLALVFAYFTTFFEIGYYYLYRDVISESTIYIILETNFSEAGDFLSMYADKKLTAIGAALLLPLLVSSFLLFRFRTSLRYFFYLNEFQKVTNRRYVMYSFSFLIVFCSILLLTELRERNFVYVAVHSFMAYKVEAKAYRLLGNDKLGGKFSNVTSDKGKDEIYVVVIGESTARSHMGLYDYYRNTNPLLNKKRSELKIYTDVISPHAHTIYSLEKVLTLATTDSPERAKDGSLLQLMNKAGFSTFWISNQNPIGADETLVTTLSNAAHKSHFTNTSAWTSTTPYDEKLLTPLKHVLSEASGKKFIVLHLMGTHGKYFRRYPASFAQFQDTPTTVFQHEKAFRFINEYDNANLYNDYIVSSIIDLVKETNKKSWVLYFSDHGEDVFETIDKATHGDDGATKPMYDIPFLIWLSEKYKQEETGPVFDTSRRFMTDDLLHTIADLGKVRFSEFDSSRSLVHPGYLVKKRSPGKIEDYDKVFSNK